MDVDDALQKIHDYCSNMNYVYVGENESKLNSKLTALNTMVYSKYYRDTDELELISEIDELYNLITNKKAYTDIMQVVEFFKKETTENMQRPKVDLMDMLRELRKRGV